MIEAEFFLTNKDGVNVYKVDNFAQLEQLMLLESSRLKTYHFMKNELINKNSEGKSLGFCHLLPEMIRMWLYLEDRLSLLPELLQYKPKDILTSGYWFPDYLFQIRYDILDEIIITMENKS